MVIINAAQVKALNPAAAFEADGVFKRAFAPLQRALDEQFRRCNPGAKFASDLRDPTPWLTRAGKGGPGYEKYRTISLARHCLDVMFLSTLTAFLLWKSGRLKPDIAPDDEEGFVKALVRLLVIALFHDADKYVGDGQSRSPTQADIDIVYRDLALDQSPDIQMTSAEIAALVNHVEQRGLANSMFLPPISPLDGQLTKAVALADGAVSDAARQYANGESADKNQAFEEQALVDSFSERLRQTFAIELPRQRVFTLRQPPAILHEVQRAILESVPYQSGLPPLVMSINGEELTFALPESLPIEDLLDEVQRQLQGGQRPVCKFNRTDGKITLSQVNTLDTLLSAMSRMTDLPYLLRIHVNDQAAVQTFVESWGGAHGIATVSNPPEAGKLYPVLSFTGCNIDGYFSEPLARALLTVALLRGGLRNPTRDFNTRVDALDEQLKKHDIISLDTLRQRFGTEVFDSFDLATRQTVIALQVAGDLNDGMAFRELAEAMFTAIFQNNAAHDEESHDPGIAIILRDLRRQLGLSTPEIVESEPYAAASNGGTCLLCGTPTSTVYQSSEFNIPELKTTAFSNRIGHRKDIYSESGETYICAGCVIAQTLLGRDLALGGRDKFKLKDSDILHTATPLRTLILPGEASRAEVQQGNLKPLQLVSSSHLNLKDPVDEALKLVPWNLDLSESQVFYLDTLTPDLTEQVSYLLNAARFSWLSGNPVHVFRIRQSSRKDALMSELVPPLIDDLLRQTFYPDKPVCSIERVQLPDFIARIDFIKELLLKNNSAKLTVLNDLRLFGWWPVAWFIERINASERLLKLAQESFAMSEHDTPLRQLAELATQIQRRPQRGAAAAGNLQGLAFDTALIVFQEFHLQQRAEKTDTVAATMGQLNDTLSRRDAYAGGKDDVTGRYRRFAEAAYDVFEAHCRKDGDLSSKTRRYLRAAYVTFFLEIHEAKKVERNATESPLNTDPASFDLS